MTETRTELRGSAEYRQIAREHLSGNWGKFALLYLILGAASIGISFVPFLGTLVQYILAGPFALGIIICMMRVFEEGTFSLEDALDGFKNFLPAFLVYLLTMIFTLLWSLLFIIPGIVAGYSYSMVYYILRENPDMPPMDVIRRSKEMMKGHRMDLFLMHLSFIGWGLLSVLTIGIGSLWLAPYVGAATTAFYLDLKGETGMPQADPTFTTY